MYTSFLSQLVQTCDEKHQSSRSVWIISLWTIDLYSSVFAVKSHSCLKTLDSYHTYS